ncbi:hypothetical protein [Streptomyces sp. NPDC096934]
MSVDSTVCRAHQLPPVPASRAPCRRLAVRHEATVLAAVINEWL